MRILLKHYPHCSAQIWQLFLSLHIFHANKKNILWGKNVSALVLYQAQWGVDFDNCVIFIKRNYLHHPLQKIICPSALALSNMYENLGSLSPQLKNLNSWEIYFQLKFFYVNTSNVSTIIC